VVQDSHNVIPVTLAVMLHVLLFGSLIVVIDFGDRNRPIVPLAIKGTLVTDNAIVIPPKVEEIVVPPEPDIDAQQRIQAEEQKRLEDQRIEQERLSRLAEEEAERKRRAEAEAERKREADEVRKEQERLAAERRRQEEIERQRLENERLRAEARRAEIEAESTRINAMTADAKAAYVFAVRQRVMTRWVMPPTAIGTECIAHIKQVPGGEVVSVRIGRCNGDSAVRQSIEAAIHRSSPLPVPADPSVFERDLQIEFRPTE